MEADGAPMTALHAMDRIWQSRSRLALEIRVKWRAVYSAQQAREKGKVDVEQDQGRATYTVLVKWTFRSLLLILQQLPADDQRWARFFLFLLNSQPRVIAKIINDALAFEALGGRHSSLPSPSGSLAPMVRSIVSLVHSRRTAL